MDYSALFTGILTDALVVSIAVFIVKKYFEHLLKRQEEATKTSNALQLEEIRAALRGDAFVRELRYSRMYERRAEVLAGMYKSERDLSLVLSDATAAPAPEWQSKVTSARASIELLRNQFTEGALYLDKDTSEQTRKLLSCFDQVLRTITSGRPQEWATAIARYNTDVPGLRILIERLFRQTLGLDEIS